MTTPEPLAEQIKRHWIEAKSEAGFQYWPHRSASDDIKWLMEQHERAMAVVAKAAQAYERLQRMYDGQDAERAKSGEIGSVHRENFEAWLDGLVDDAKATLDAAQETDRDRP